MDLLFIAPLLIASHDKSLILLLLVPLSYDDGDGYFSCDRCLQGGGGVVYAFPESSSGRGLNDKRSGSSMDGGYQPPKRGRGRPRKVDLVKEVSEAPWLSITSFPSSSLSPLWTFSGARESQPLDLVFLAVLGGGRLLQ